MRSFGADGGASQTMSGSSLDFSGVTGSVGGTSRGGDDDDEDCKQVVIKKMPNRRRREKTKSPTSPDETHHSSRRQTCYFRPFPVHLRPLVVVLLVLLIPSIELSAAHGETPFASTTLSSLSPGYETDTTAGGQTPGSPTILPPLLMPLTSQQPQPCDRSRKVFTSAFGEISDGPVGANYTQASTIRVEYR